MALYNKNKTGSIKTNQLQVEINNDLTIVPSCTSISSNGDDLIIEFADTLTGAEETQLDTLVENHVPTADLVNAAMFPISDIDGIKLAVHSSPKPDVPGVKSIAVWTGAGDDPITGSIGGGELLGFECTPGTALVEIDVKFSPVNGRIWIHEGYLKFDNGGVGDYMDSLVICNPTPLQTSVNLDLVIDGDWIKYSLSGPGTGTHGFADPTLISLVPRPFLKDGDWDYDGTNLTPNFAGDGNSKISAVEKVVSKFLNKIPVKGTSSFFTMTSDETTELPANFFLRIRAHNVSNTTWSATAIMEIYREKTVDD